MVQKGVRVEWHRPATQTSAGLARTGQPGDAHKLATLQCKKHGQADQFLLPTTTNNLRNGGPVCELLDAFPEVRVGQNIPAAIWDTVQIQDAAGHVAESAHGALRLALYVIGTRWQAVRSAARQPVKVRESTHTSLALHPYDNARLHVYENDMLCDVFLDLLRHRFGSITLRLWLEVLVSVGAEGQWSPCAQ